MAKPRWGFDRFRAWEWHMERAISGLPRSCEADAWEEEQRGFHRARSAGVNENSLSKLKLFQNAPCGDVVEMFLPNPNLILR